MGFLIHGRDGADFDDGPHALHEAHQTYMDQWSSQFLARGPTLSEDGAKHTGSIHVLDNPDREVAQKFAFDEPYARAGWYAEIAVSPFESVLEGTMWDRPAPSVDHESSFALASWAPTNNTAQFVDAVRDRIARADGPQWTFVGLLLSDDSAHIIGLAGGVDLPAPATRSWLPARLTALPVTLTDLAVHRWRRGGRQQG